MAAIIPAVVGALGAAALSKSSKVSAPAPRDYGTEGANTLADQIALSPQLYEAEKTYRP